jgi:imidazole glycerol-phosphate synthase subunit HisH
MERGIPILGICLGMQLMTSYSEEGDCEGLGFVKARSTRFPKPANRRERVPHVGWNEVERMRDSLLFRDIAPEARFYFTHSYCVTCDDEDDVVGSTSYIREFASVFCHGNVYGTQFHPEKSHAHGLKLVDNFARYA